MLNFDLSVTKPNYLDGSIVNLMSTIKQSYGVESELYRPLANLPLDRLSDAKRIVLLVIDGLGADLLKQFSAAPGSLGIFQQHLTGRLTSVYPPTTASAITTFMSGQAPQQHGLTGWFMNFREIGATAAVLPFTPRYGRGTLTEQGVAIGDLIDCQTLPDCLPTSCHMLLPEVIAHSDFSRLLGGSANRLGFKDMQDFAYQLSAFAAERQTNGGYMYAYWSELDHLSHVYGPSDPRVLEHFQQLERALSAFLEQAPNDGTCVIITADHGFLDSGPCERINLGAHPELADMLAMPLFGEPRSAYCIVRKGQESAFEQYLAEALSHAVTLRVSAELVAENWFGLGPPHPELRARVGDYTLQMKERFTVGDQLVSEKAFDLLGMHGGVTASEQWVPLVVV